MKTLIVPGRIYDECLSPDCTEFPRENPDLPKPTYRKVGRGGQFTYEPLTDEQYALMIEHIRDFGEALSYGADPECMYMARRIVRWVDKLEGTG